jgi:glycosyltransferase involved in cell wall biosynthesis
LTWVGLGAFPSDDEYAHQLCASLGLTDHITLAGQLSDEEKFFELSRADILVLPTHTEGFPLSLLEGMAMGLPVVTTPVGGIPEIVKDGVNGYLVSPKDVEMLAERILTLVKEPGKRQRMGEANARLYREQLSAHKVVARIHTLLRELI